MIIYKSINCYLQQQKQNNFTSTSRTVISEQVSSSLDRRVNPNYNLITALSGDKSVLKKKIHLRRKCNKCFINVLLLEEKWGQVKCLQVILHVYTYTHAMPTDENQNRLWFKCKHKYSMIFNPGPSKSCKHANFPPI